MPRSNEVSSQIDRFRETAHALGVDEDEGRFRDKLRVIARQKPKPPAKKATAKRRAKGCG